MESTEKQCPYCKEAVKGDAVKCRYCQSPLTDEAPKANAGSVTYVLDAGLVKFSKFAALILALFFGFGVYVFGFNLEKAADKLASAREAIEKKTQEMNKTAGEMLETQKKLQESQQKLVQLEESTKAAEHRVTAAEKRVLDIQQEVERYRGGIQGNYELSVVLIDSIRNRERGDEATRATSDNNVPVDSADKTRPGNSVFEKRLWRNGSTIKVAFLDGRDEVRARVQRVAMEWTRHVNLKFEFTDRPAGSDVRVSFKDTGSWSMVGTDALKAPSDVATINFGWITSDTEEAEVRRVVLHEFGHVLGLIEEMSNPNNGIKWDVAAVYRWFQGAPTFWDKSSIDRNILQKCSLSDCPKYRSFDAKSIMMFPIPKGLTTDGFSVGINVELSESDKKFAAELYPRS